MSNRTGIYGWFYTQFLRLYPEDFLAEFAREMEDVFVQATEESNGKALNFYLRELKDLPSSLFCEHWYARMCKEVSMATNFKRPEWFFYPAWVGLSILAFPLAFLAYIPVIAMITRWLGDIIQVHGQTHITEDYLFSYIFFPSLCLLSGLLQFLLLRRYAPKMGWWILATGLGSLCAIAALGLLQFAFTAFMTFWGNMLIFAIIGGMIGIGQWLFLRRRVPRAGWWLIASTLGWGLAVLGSLTAVKHDSVLAQLLSLSLSPAIITSIAWWYLLKTEAQLEKQGI
jgi:hypothetical protein